MESGRPGERIVFLQTGLRCLFRNAQIAFAEIKWAITDGQNNRVKDWKSMIVIDCIQNQFDQEFSYGKVNLVII